MFGVVSFKVMVVVVMIVKVWLGFWFMVVRVSINYVRYFWKFFKIFGKGKFIEI